MLRLTFDPLNGGFLNDIFPSLEGVGRLTCKRHTRQPQYSTFEVTTYLAPSRRGDRQAGKQVAQRFKHVDVLLSKGRDHRL